MSGKATGRLKVELAISLIVGLVCALVLSPAMMGRIDEMLVTFLSIVLAAVIPGIALTASAARPPVTSPLQARQFGARLAGQVRFWFGFLWTGGLAVALIVGSRAVEWKLATPRLSMVPNWVPEGHAWLVFFSMSAVAFVAVRARHVVTAVQSLIQVGTDLHADQVGARAREVQDEIRQQISNAPTDPARGRAVEDRSRH